jgi:hypothetical protein
MTYVYDIDVDTICFLFVCADVAPRRHEVELRRASARQEPERSSRVGERHQREDVGARLANPKREMRRHRFDDPGVGPSHAPPADAGENFKTFATAWRQCYGACLRACGHVSRMTVSWSSVWGFHHHGRLWYDGQ